MRASLGGRHLNSWWLHLTPPNTGDWRSEAACARHPTVAATAWDDTLESATETPAQRTKRTGLAKAVCLSECPVRDRCLADVELPFDDGIRAAVDLRTIRNCPSCRPNRDLPFPELLAAHRNGHQQGRAAS